MLLWYVASASTTNAIKAMRSCQNRCWMRRPQRQSPKTWYATLRVVYALTSGNVSKPIFSFDFLSIILETKVDQPAGGCCRK